LCLSDFAKLALAGNKNAVAKSIEQYKPAESGNYRNQETESKKGGAFIGIVYEV